MFCVELIPSSFLDPISSETYRCYKSVLVLLFRSPRVALRKEGRPLAVVSPPHFLSYCWFSHDVTKIQNTKLSILLRFYFHGVLEELKTNFQTNFPFKRFLGLVIEYA